MPRLAAIASRNWSYPLLQIMFKLFLATVGFGLLHGFFFLPALLQLSYSAR